jgi:hypothetical protein
MAPDQPRPGPASASTPLTQCAQPQAVIDTNWSKSQGVSYETSPQESPGRRRERSPELLSWRPTRLSEPVSDGSSEESIAAVESRVVRIHRAKARAGAWRGLARGNRAEDLPPVRDAFLSAFQTKRPFRFEYRLRRTDGVYRWVLNVAVPRLEPDGRFAGYIGSAVDITEMKQLDHMKTALLVRPSRRDHQGP